jgi:hypothetical protein
MESLSGYPIRIQEENFESKIGATMQMAWKLRPKTPAARHEYGNSPSKSLRWLQTARKA